MTNSPDYSASPDSPSDTRSSAQRKSLIADSDIRPTTSLKVDNSGLETGQTARINQPRFSPDDEIRCREKGFKHLEGPHDPVAQAKLTAAANEHAQRMRDLGQKRREDSARQQSKRNSLIAAAEKAKIVPEISGNDEEEGGLIDGDLTTGFDTVQFTSEVSMTSKGKILTDESGGVPNSDISSTEILSRDYKR